MTTYLVRVLYSWQHAADEASIGTRHPTTDPWRDFRLLFCFFATERELLLFTKSPRETRLHLVGCRTPCVHTPRSLEAKAEGLAGGRSPGRTVAPTDVAIVSRLSISLHDGFRRKAIDFFFAPPMETHPPTRRTRLTYVSLFWSTKQVRRRK